MASWKPGASKGRMMTSSSFVFRTQKQAKDGGANAKPLSLASTELIFLGFKQLSTKSRCERCHNHLKLIFYLCRSNSVLCFNFVKGTE